ncbi:MAG: NADP-dependent malic enzyme [Burkholderiaceae bacterium]
MDQQFRRAALEYHETGRPGKISVTPTKGLTNQRDLALAYSPGVAAACDEIVADPANAFRYTARGNLVAVVTNGSAVLGLGNIGPLAAKPVMEGKAVLFKKFAGIDVFDLEIASNSIDHFVEVVASLEPTFGGVNLEDIKAPDCFEIERRLRERMNIPVFHDDQHGTAIVVAAALLNGLQVVDKPVGEIKLVVSGAGAAALACLDLLLDVGVRRENIWVTDIAGVVYEGRTELMDPDKARFAQPTELRTLAQVIEGADAFLGLSAGGVLKPAMVATMAARPLIFALANPNPEILPEDVRSVRDDAFIATGRTDYPNQVNNVLCFPFIFRGALDVGATTVNRQMEIAAVHALADLARAEQSDEASLAYGGSETHFGPEYLIPRPFDPRLIVRIAPAVARAAMDSGVALRPIADFRTYHEQLQQFVYHSGTFMKPVFAAARQGERKRIVFCEGEDERVLRAVQATCDEGIAAPILVGRPMVIERLLDTLGLRIRAGTDFELINPEQDDRYRAYWQAYHQIAERRGVTEALARLEMRRNTTLIGAMLMHMGEADGMICGTVGPFAEHLAVIDRVIGKAPGASCYAAMNTLMLPGRQLTLVDTHVNLNPSAGMLAEITILAADTLRRLGIQPHVALLSHSNYGSSDDAESVKMREVLSRVRMMAPELDIDGEMHGDVALDIGLRRRLMPGSTLSAEANLIVLPNLDAANIAYNLLKTAAGNNVAIGPVLLGAARPVHILTPSATTRRIFNMCALTVIGANAAQAA